MANTHKWKIGNSIQGRSIEVEGFWCNNHKLENSVTMPSKENFPWILIIGGVHGEEIEGVWLTDELSKHFNKQYPYHSFGVLLLLNANPDGTSNLQRTNANQIDLNRNLPTKDWSAEFTNPRYNPGKTPGSEPENKALLQLINSIQPLAILSLHSFSKVQVNLNGTQHGSAVRDWGQKMAEDCGYPLTEDIGYPTPGCLGTYAGSERGIPTITLEIERGMSEENVRKKFVPTVLKGLNYWEK